MGSFVVTIHGFFNFTYRKLLKISLCPCCGHKFKKHKKVYKISADSPLYSEYVRHYGRLRGKATIYEPNYLCSYCAKEFLYDTINSISKCDKRLSEVLAKNSEKLKNYTIKNVWCDKNDKEIEFLPQDYKKCTRKIIAVNGNEEVTLVVFLLVPETRWHYPSDHEIPYCLKIASKFRYEYDENIPNDLKEVREEILRQFKYI